MIQERFETFTVLVNRISRNIRKIKNREMAEYRLKSVHVSCLYYIYTLESATATDLCERCAEDKATISRALDYLDTNGYITREAESVKRYKNPLFLTGKGVEAAKKIADKIGDIFDVIGDSLTEQERADFYRSLSVISNSLDKCAKALNSK